MIASSIDPTLGLVLLPFVVGVAWFVIAPWVWSALSNICIGILAGWIIHEGWDDFFYDGGDGEGGEDWDWPPIPLPEDAKAALGGLLIVGALILAATMLKGRE